MLTFFLARANKMLHCCEHMQCAFANMATFPKQDKFTIAAKKSLIDRGQTITDLAGELRFARNTVSMAINHPILPTVRRKIAKHLRLEGVQ